jgi:hypothetical protein
MWFGNPLKIIWRRITEKGLKVYRMRQNTSRAIVLSVEDISKRRRELSTLKYLPTDTMNQPEPIATMGK